MIAYSVERGPSYFRKFECRIRNRNTYLNHICYCVEVKLHFGDSTSFLS
jgi:hypothetical protein